jgi:hypothetical protein
MASFYESDFYLVVRKKNGYMSRLSGRLVTGAPVLAAGEVPIKLTIKVPQALFVKPQLAATITIPESAVSKPVIDATVLDNVREVLEQQTGMAISVSLVENEQ